MNTEQERAELLPCPFCGESKNLTVQHHEGTIIHPAYRIYCGNCGASSGYADRVDPAKYWNSRAALQSQDREDRARLDWIERNARRDPDMTGNHTWWPTSFNKTIRGPSLRDAIDYARRVEGEG